MKKTLHDSIKLPRKRNIQIALGTVEFSHKFSLKSPRKKKGNDSHAHKKGNINNADEKKVDCGQKRGKRVLTSVSIACGKNMNHNIITDIPGVIVYIPHVCLSTCMLLFFSYYTPLFTGK